MHACEPCFSVALVGIESSAIDGQLLKKRDEVSFFRQQSSCKQSTDACSENSYFGSITMQEGAIIQLERLGSAFVIASERHIAMRNERQDMKRDVIWFDGKLTTREVITHSLQQKGLNGQLEQVSIISSSSMETSDFTGSSTCSFGENHERISLIRHSPYECLFRFFIQRKREAVQLTSDGMEDRIIPDIILHHNRHLRRLRKDKHNVDMGLMIGDNNRRLFSQSYILRIINGIMESAKQ